MAFRWGADDGPLLVVFGSSLPSSTKKGLSELDPPCHNFLDPRMKCPSELVRSLSYHSDIVMLIFMANRRNCIIYINSIITGRSPLLALAYFHDINTEKKPIHCPIYWLDTTTITFAGRRGPRVHKGRKESI